MNLTALQTAVANLGYDPSLTTVTTQFLNDVYHEIASSDRWPWLDASTTASLAAGANSVAIPGAAQQVDAVRAQNTAGVVYNMTNMSPQDWRNNYYDSGAQPLVNQPTGPPKYWTMIGPTIYVYPYADVAYTLQIDYNNTITDLANPTDTPVFPAEFHDVLVFGAASRMAMRERDPTMQQIYDAQYQRKLTKMRDAYLLRQRQTSSRVAVSGFFGRGSSSTVWW